LSFYPSHFFQPCILFCETKLRVPIALRKMLFMHSWSLRDLNIFTVALVISFLLLRWSTIKTYSFLFHSRSRGKGLAGTTNTEYLHVTLANTTPIKSCLDPDGPQPLIPMSLGRSGSGSTYQIIGNLTGMHGNSI
jgi:hypothetical protein